MAQLTGLGIENFRIFKDYTEFKFAPLTLLTGANNSGKSSLIKALLLLADNSEKNNVIDLDFSGQFSEIHNLATFDLSLNNEAFIEKNRIKFDLFYEIDSATYKLILEYEKHETNNRLLNYRVQKLDKATDKYFYIYGIKYQSYEQYSSFLGIAYFMQQKFIDLLTPSDYFNTDTSTSINLNLISKEIIKIVTNINVNLSNDFLYLLNKYTVEWLSYPPQNIVKLELGYIFNQLHYEKISAFAKLATIGNFPYIKKDFLDNEAYQPFFEALSTFSIRDILKKEYADYLLEIPNDAFLFVKNLRNQITFEYESAVRANSKRLYKNTSEGTAFNSLLYQFNKMNLSDNGKEKLFIKKWLDRLGIADNIKFIWEEQLGTRIKVYRNNKELDLTDLGFAVTQLLPMLIHIVICRTKCLIIEEPENSLHPNFQSQLADMLIDAHKTFGINFIVETHSEYLIRKLQYLTAKKEITGKEVAIYYFQVDGQIQSIDIQEDGRLSQEFGKGFFDEAIDLMMSTYSLQKKAKN